MWQLHSFTDAGAAGCEAVVRLPGAWLRPYVVGYSGYRSSSGARDARRRVLALNVTTLIVEFDGGGYVTGARGGPFVRDGAGWLHGMTIGLTPVGVCALLGMPMRELVGEIVPLDAVFGRRSAFLGERLGGARTWDERFALLDEQLTQWLEPPSGSGGRTVRAWWRLQETAGRIRVATLADELGVGRRTLEVGFRREIGLPPKQVARIARFQRAVRALAVPSAGLGTAVECGYADQPHLTREVRALSGITPGELFAFVQDRGRPAG
ncbi:helix-turn-helix domain-containing protein [Actinocorallia populi]|uniref:helix-turn-helix domain-containing protein n=1 Tax=Actinocorallia populi TaxID=2079200 RepID=UPI000D08A9CE|nr:helix-turn-helix transcriptional regulator [Actinocorallia populi]